MVASDTNGEELKRYQLATKIKAPTRAIAWRLAARQMLCAIDPPWSAEDLAGKTGIPFKYIKSGLRPHRGGFPSVEHQRAIAQAFADAGVLHEFWAEIDGKWEKLWPVELADAVPSPGD